jgi:hypothetical protein
MCPRITAHNQTRNVNVVAFKMEWQTVLIHDGIVRNTVVSNQGVGEHEDLTAIRRISQGFWVTNHARVKDDFSRHVDGGSEGTPLQNGIFLFIEIQKGGFAL